MWLLILLYGIWCSKIEVCKWVLVMDILSFIKCSCVSKATSIADINKYSICCGNKETSDTPPQNKNGTWCSDISTSSITNSKYIGTLNSNKYYCNDYVDTSFAAKRTPQITKHKTQKIYDIVSLYFIVYSK